MLCPLHLCLAVLRGLPVLVSSRLWGVCCTNCASSRCRLVKARWPSAMAVSPYRTTPATPMICTALFVSSLQLANLPSGLFIRPFSVSIFIFFFLYVPPPPRIYVGAGSRQKARHLPGVLFCFQTSSADVPGAECEGQSLSALKSAGTSGFA